MRNTLFKRSLLVSIAIFAVAVVAPVASSVQPAQAQANRPDVSQQREQAQARAQTAQERVDQIKQEVEQRRTTIKQEVCERRQAQLRTIMPRLATGATAVKTAIDTVYTRVQGFYESSQLTVENYDQLKTVVDVAKTDSEAALKAVEDYKFVLDCDNPNVGDQLDGYRTAVKQARDALKIYRTELVGLISALQASAAESADTNATVEGEGNA